MREPGPLVLVLGGARSGKSAFAEKLMEEWPPPWTYLATAQAFDGEMRDRIRAHRERRDARWRTVDAPHDLARVVARIDLGPMLIDCLTLWLSNRMLAEADCDAEGSALVEALRARRAPTVVVSNEVGLGIVPDNALARRFRDEAGRLNGRVAQAADAAHFVAAGLPLTLK